MQNCELKKKSFFEILFAAPIGTLARFAGPPGWHSRLNHHAVLNFYVEILGDRFSAAFAVLTAEIHTRKTRGKIWRTKFGEKNHFSLRFSLSLLFFCFSLFSVFLALCLCGAFETHQCIWFTRPNIWLKAQGLAHENYICF